MIKATITSGQKRGDEVTDRPDLRFNWPRGRPLSAHVFSLRLALAKVCRPIR